MADDKDESIEEGKETKKKKSKLMLIIIPLVVVLLGGGGFFAYKTLIAPSGGGDEQASSENGGHGKSSGKKHSKKKAKQGGHGEDSEDSSGDGPTFFDLAPFVVNLQDNIGTRYLKLTVKLELAEAGTEGELKGQLPRIRDALIILLSSKNYSEIGTVEGKYRLRDEIVKRINRLLKEASVRGAYFTDFVIQ